MKKVFSLVLALSLVAALFAGMPVFADGEEIAVAGDGSKVTLDLEKGTIETYNGNISAKRTQENVKTTADGDAVKAYVISNAQSGDCITWNVNFAKAGNYKIEVPVYSQSGAGVISAQIDSERMYAAGNFTAGGYGKPVIYNNTAVLYVTAEAGDTYLTIFFETLGANILSPTISYFEGEIPAEPAFDKHVGAVETDAFTNNPTKALLLTDGSYYGLHANFGKDFKGFILPQWTPGGGKGHCKFNVGVYAWDEDEATTLTGTPVASKELTTPGDIIMICKFDEAIPAGEYYIYVECVELILDEGTSHSTGIDMHMKTGLPHSFDDFVYYFEAFTNIENYVPVPDRMVFFSFIVDEFVEPEDFFLELGAGDEEPGASEEPDASADPDATPDTEPSEKPQKTDAPATSKPSTKPAASPSAPKADDTDNDSNTTLIIIIVVAAVVVVGGVAAAIIIIKKKK